MDLKEAIERIEGVNERNSEISLSGMNYILKKVTEEDSDLNQKQYAKFEKYLGDIDKAIEERRENSFANRVGVLETLRSFYD
jgi:hypothetical protein